MKTTAKTLKTTILAATFFAVIPLHGIAGEPQRARDLGVPFEGTPGEMTGTWLIDEIGGFAGPVMLTGTSSVGMKWRHVEPSVLAHC